MPHRLVSAGILIFWALASGALIVRDVLPDYLIGPPPDLRSIALAEAKESRHPSRWAILVEDEEHESTPLRAVGQAVTESFRQGDGYVMVSSDAWFDAGEVLKGTPLGASAGPSERILVRGSYLVDRSGNLHSFWASVRASTETKEIISLTGVVRRNRLEIRSEGPLPWLTWTRYFPYQPRGIVQNALGPLDRMPGLQVGQRWISRMVSPLTGSVQEVRVEVTGKRVITWDSNPVTTLEVVTNMPPIKARTWVRPDGLVLRQEAPFPFVRLLLERQPERSANEPTEDRRR